MIELSGLNLSVGAQPILRDIELSVADGECLCLIGASGGGKTSLLHLLLGLLESGHRDPAKRLHWSGSAMVAGTDVLRAKPSELRALRGGRLGFVPQGLSDALNPHLTVRRHLSEMAAAHRLGPLDLASLCRARNIPEPLLDRYPADLSGGEIQRVLLALARLTAPDHLILDEPTASLDPANKRIVIEALRGERGRQCRLLVTHDLDLVHAVADRVAVLDHGRIVETGPADDVLKRPECAATTHLLSHDRPRSRTRRPAQSAYGKPPSSGGTDRAGLRISGLTHRYGTRPIFEDLSLFFARGARIVIEGESGVGKSTLARLLTGFETIRQGTVEWHETRSGAAPPGNRPPAALVPQLPHRALTRHFSVEEALREAIRLTSPKGRRFTARPLQEQEQERERIVHTLERVRLPRDSAFRARQTAMLSGGEAQRLVIARTLLTASPCLVADEPTAALDIQTKAQILSLLAEISDRRGSVLIVFSHDETVAEILDAERFKLQDGRLSPA